MWHDHLIKDTGEVVYFKSLYGRLNFCLSAYIFVVLLILFKVIEIMTGNYWSYAYVDKSQLHPNARAVIRDRNGKILATTIKTFDLHLNCKNCLEPIESYKRFSKMFGKELSGFNIRKIKNKRGFIVIKQHLTPRQKQKIMELGLTGTELPVNYKRFYPYGKVASHVLGFVNHKNRGRAGIEMGMDSKIRKNVTDDIHTTLDIRIQCAAFDILRQEMIKYQYVAASAIVIDCESSDILAMVNFPSFNANKPKSPNNKEMFDHASQGLYEVGSIAKIFNTALALNAKKVNIYTKFDVSKPFFVNRNYKITDLIPTAGELSVADVFRCSSNIGSAKMALLVGAEEQQKFFRHIGLMDQFFVRGLPSIPYPKYPKFWNKAVAAAISFGYAHTSSALQLTAAFNGIINNGRYTELNIIKSKNKAKVLKKIVGSKVSSQIRALMHYTVAKGSGRRAWIDNYFVAGKTGSSNVLEKTGNYNKDKTNSCFVAFVTNNLKKPKYLVFVQLIEPQRLKETHGYNTAGWNASVLTRKIIANITNIKALPPLKNKLKKCNIDRILEQA